jgi:ribose transport system substrate-binding protein
MSEISRRKLLKLGALGVGGLAGLELVTACSSASSPAASVSATTSAAPGAQALAAFVPGKTGAATNLPKRVAWASTADSEFFLALSAGMKAAAAARGMHFATATGADPTTHVDQLNSFLAQGVGALAMQPLDPAAEKPVLLKAIGQGVCAQGIITSPCTMQIAASQYQIGYDQGVAAAQWAKTHLGGKAQVAYFNLDTISPQLKLRHNGVLDGLKTGGSGIQVVSDQTITDISNDAGFKATNAIIQAHPDVKVVMGGDTLVVGAYHALNQAGKLSSDMFLSGVDGDSEAQSLIKQGGAYRLSIAFAWGLMGYGLGQFGADWIAGKSVPRVLVAKGVHLDSAATVTKFQRDSANPGPVFADTSAYQAYLPLLGNVSYATRNQYWTTEYTPK